MTTTFLRRILTPFADLRDDESVTAVLMFGYAFLALTAYNIIQPLTRSKVIESLGAVNVPYVILAQGVVIGALMVGYTRLYSVLPKRWALPIIQTALASVMVLFWALFRLDQDWVSVAFYVWGALVGLLLTSQFWTLANGIYDPRQAKRIFGFVGGGIALGGMTGAALTAYFVEHVGANALLLVSAGSLVLCVPLVSVVLAREEAAGAAAARAARDEKGVTISRAIHLLRESKQVQLVALVIAFGSLGAALLDQQVNMAAESLGKANSISKFLAQLRFGVSAAAFVIQVWVTPRIHRYLGVGFALLILPTNLGATAAAIILTKNIWAPAFASMGDRSLRYSVDKTTREVLFLPLPSELRQEVKPFVDVTVDRVARGVGGIVILLLVQPWGLHLTWYQLAWVSLMLTVAWYFMAIRAKNQYLQSFRQSIARHDVDVDVAGRVNVADLATVEALVEELAAGDEARVVYAIDILESVGKRNLITPLLLHHTSARVRARALEAMEGAPPELGERWLPAIERALTDTDYDVRTAAVRALATLRRERAAELMRPYLEDKDPRLVITAAIALAGSPDQADVEATEAALRALIDDARADAVATRREVAQAMPSIKNRRIHHLLLPLFYDLDTSVALDAIRSAKVIGESDALFVPPLVALLRHRVLKAAARDVLVGYGEPVVEVLGHFLRDTEEDPWVRRHIPATLARIPAQRSADLLAGALDDADGFLRFKALSALEAVVRERPGLVIDRSRLEAQATRQAMLFFQYFSLRDSLRRGDPQADGMLLARAVDEKIERTKDRIYRLLGLMYGWKDIAGARWALERGDARARASAAEFLDNLLKGDLRKRVMAVVEDMPYEERVRRANVVIRSRPRDIDDTVAQLVADEDQAVASAAIHYVEARRLDGLESDLEHTLAHRDVRDFAVFESASWALASWRMPTEDRREVAGAAARRRGREPPAPCPAVRARIGRRAVPHRRDREAGAVRIRPARQRRRGPRDDRVPARRPRHRRHRRRARRADDRDRGARRDWPRGDPRGDSAAVRHHRRRADDRADDFRRGFSDAAVEQPASRGGTVPRRNAARRRDQDGAAANRAVQRAAAGDDAAAGRARARAAERADLRARGLRRAPRARRDRQGSATRDRRGSVCAGRAAGGAHGDRGSADAAAERRRPRRREIRGHDRRRGDARRRRLRFARAGGAGGLSAADRSRRAVQSAERSRRRAPRRVRRDSRASRLDLPQQFRDDPILFRQHGAQVEQQPAALDPRDDGRRQAAQPCLERVGTDAVARDRHRPRRQLDARRAAAAHRRHAVDDFRVPAVDGADRGGERVRPGADFVGGLREHPTHRHCRVRASGGVVDECRLERRVRHLVDAQRAHQRVAADAVDEYGAPHDDSGLRSAEEFVAAEAADVDAGGDRRGHRRLVESDWRPTRV